MSTPDTGTDRPSREEVIAFHEAHSGGFLRGAMYAETVRLLREPPVLAVTEEVLRAMANADLCARGEEALEHGDQHNYGTCLECNRVVLAAALAVAPAYRVEDVVRQTLVVFAAGATNHEVEVCTEGVLARLAAREKEAKP